MQFGCFVQLEGLRGRHEGLVHISQVSLKNADDFKSGFSEGKGNARKQVYFYLNTNRSVHPDVEGVELLSENETRGTEQMGAQDN